MKLDTRLTSSALTLALAAVVIPFTADWQLPLLNGVVVRWIENGQALWLLFGALFTALVYTATFPSRRGKAVLAMGCCLVGGAIG